MTAHIPALYRLGCASMPVSFSASRASDGVWRRPRTIARSVAKTGRLLIVDEAFGPYGIGAEIAAQLADRGFDDLDAPIRRLNGVHTPTPYSPPLENTVVPNVDAIAQAIRDLVAE